MCNRIVIGIFLITFLIVGGMKISAHLKRQQLIREQQQVQISLPESQLSSVALPSTSSSKAMQSSVVSSVHSSKSGLRDSVNWDVPFTSQAPLAHWDALHEEACEEASVLMVLRFFAGQPIASASDAEQAIQNLVAKNAALGFPVDNTAEQIVALIHAEDPTLQASLLSHPTEEQLKKVLSEGSLVVVPASGRQLDNPYYTAPGPLYHMLVIRGYATDDQGGYAITNDPGTKRGKQYAYRWSVLLGANHDWNGGDVEQGERVVVVVGSQ